MSEHKAQETGLRIVFVHGAGENAAAWDAQTSYFAHAEAVNLPGHHPYEFVGSEGRSTVDDYARWLHDYIRAEHNVDKETRKVLLVGHSMGSSIVLKYALMFGKEFLAGIVLVGGGAKMRVSPKILEGLQTDYKATIDLLIDYAYTAAATPEMKLKSQHMKLLMSPEIAYGDFMACSNFDITMELEKLPRIPTLVIGATADQLMPPKLSHYLAENIPGAQLQIMDATGHNMHVEKPHEFNKILDEFISTLKR
ncbi:alpha/beta hydrolase [Candidatus Chlorohelix sp.]|uniref:alpha/beta fold hydrolase n=1 Tax=Candidatus Chlorohelix sp. TaxID=3139201 RepID=UPI0030277D55